MEKWNVRTNSKMIYHHMDEERMYPQDTMDKLMNELITSYRAHELDEKEIRRLFGEEIDTEQMRNFWKERARTHKVNEGITNLEEDEELLQIKVAEENKMIDSYIDLGKNDILLDLGCGHGYWALRFADKVKQVHAVDYSSEMIDLGIKRAQDNGIKNIKFFENSVQEFTANVKYDTIFISGLLLYLNDADIRTLIKRILGYTKKGTQLILREGTGMEDRYIIDNECSERLGVTYSAIYRTREEFVKIFGKAGFKLVDDENMFPEGSNLNKFPETRLRIYKFLRTDKVR